VIIYHFVANVPASSRNHESEPTVAPGSLSTHAGQKFRVRAAMQNLKDDSIQMLWSIHAYYYDWEWSRRPMKKNNRRPNLVHLCVPPVFSYPHPQLPCSDVLTCLWFDLYCILTYQNVIKALDAQLN